MTDLRFQKIDETNRADHTFIRADDRCLFLREYTSHKSYSYSETNSCVSNLKKKKGQGGYQYKAPAIERCAREMADALNPDWLKTATLIPVPPSKWKRDPAYDDRMLQVCRRIAARSRIQVDIRELVVQTRSLQAAHEADARPTVADLLEVYEIDEALTQPKPKAIGIVDDVLTAGTHFRAMCHMIEPRFHGVKITGLFWARRVLPPDELI